MNTKKTIEEVRKELLNPKKQIPTEIRGPKSSQESDLLTYLKQSTDDTFICKSVVYIDDDVHEVLTRLKKRTGIKIGHLLSSLAKDFFVDNEKEIKKVLNRNKYLQ